MGIDYKKGDVVTKKSDKEKLYRQHKLHKRLYMYLGEVEKGQRSAILEEANKIMGDREMGWFTHYPLEVKFDEGNKIDIIVFSPDLFSKHE